MTRHEWTLVKDITGEAYARPATERDDYIAGRCGADDSLSGEVRSLLDSVVQAEDLYEGAAFSGTALLAAVDQADAPGAPVIGARIGVYRVLSELGRGGMGAAYLAVRDDQTYHKRVAIKLIKRGMDTDAILRRFRHERQMLADLQHPNIVMLLDGGTTADGRPYFVMEYVDGLPLDAYCDAKTLTIPERLQLFEAVCGAVHHAHTQRIIHRDLKPSNILVQTGGVPKLLDFGIAALLDAEDGSPTADRTLLKRVMTPQYASPEQIRGQEPTAASDVYSLGMLLYVLLAGAFPYRLSDSSHEPERTIVEKMPRPPSTAVTDAASAARGERTAGLRRRLTGDLDTIALTALQKSPERRYATAAAMAEDIRRYLHGHPIAARERRMRGTLPAFLRRRASGSPDAGTPWRMRLAAVAAAVGLVLIVLSAIMAGRRSPAGPAAAPLVMAVLPFAYSGDDPDLEYLAEGVTEDLINRLSRVKQLRVIGRNSVVRYKGRPVDVQQVGRELGVDVLLSGRLVRRGEGLSIAAELVDARNGSQLWGDRYEQASNNIVTIQRDLTQRITDSLRLQFTTQERALLVKSYTDDTVAYELYLRGRYFWNRRTPQSLKRSIGYFEQAVSRDARFALAYSGLADAYALLTEYHTLPARDTYEPARRAAIRALEIDDRLAEAHTSLAYIHQFYEWDWPAAEREFTRALELNPNYATAHQWYAEFLSASGRHDQALAEIRRAIALDPVSLIVNAVEANLLYMAARYDEAIAKAREAIDMDPNFPEAYEYLKRALDQKGQYAEAIAARQARRRALGLNVADTAALRGAAVATSPREYWRHRLAQEIEESRAEGTGAFEFAEILTQAGDTGAALDWLERACANNDFLMAYARVAPNLLPLHAEPRYRTIAQRGCAVR